VTSNNRRDLRDAIIIFLHMARRVPVSRLFNGIILRVPAVRSDTEKIDRFTGMSGEKFGSNGFLSAAEGIRVSRPLWSAL